MSYILCDSNLLDTGSPCDVMSISIKRKHSLDNEIPKKICLDRDDSIEERNNSYNYDTNWILNYLGSTALSTHLNNLTIRRVQSSLIPVLTMLMTYKDNKDVFNSPVDPIEQGIPDYLNVIKNPQDFGSIRSKLISGFYVSPTPVINDIRTVFSNAMIYNPSTHPVHQLASRMSKIFEYELKKVVVRLKNCDKQLNDHICELCNGRMCYLCGDKCLKYCPPVIYCDGPCMQRILRNSYYYTVKGKKGRWCVKCQPKMLHSLTKEERKTKLQKHKNDQIEGEPWIQCNKCNKWVHQICGLYNKKHGSDSYSCPVCRLSDSNILNNDNSTYNEWKGAFELKKTQLSEIIENAVKERIIGEYKIKSPSSSEDEIESVLDSISIRVVSNKEDVVDVIPPLRIFYGGKPDEPVHFHGKSKVILLFQRCSGIDVLLFALYVREYNKDAPSPNTNCVYISYLDSIHFLKPPFLRTPIYHTILQSYIGYARDLGFTSCRIWTCPPTRGDDYIFYDHPKEQRTPTPQRLLQWYKKMLGECEKKGYVYNITCAYDLMKESLYWKEDPKDNSSQTNIVKAIMRVLPYFEGDYWPVVCSQIASDMKENRPYCKPKKINRQNYQPESKPHNNQFDNCFNNLPLLIKKFIERMYPQKDRFIVAHLVPYCHVCGKYINNGKIFSCEQCLESKLHYDLCEECYNNSFKHKHTQFTESSLNIIPPLTDPEPYISSPIIDNRHTFLRVCQGNHLQFDTHRHAIYSTLMVLYLFSCKKHELTVRTCDRCLLSMDNKKCYTCDICHDFDLCNECYRIEGHEHSMHIVDLDNVQG